MQLPDTIKTIVEKHTSYITKRMDQNAIYTFTEDNLWDLLDEILKKPSTNRRYLWADREEMTKKLKEEFMKKQIPLPLPVNNDTITK